MSGEVIAVDAVFKGEAVVEAEAPIDDFEMALARFAEFARGERAKLTRRCNDLERENAALRSGTPIE